MKEKENEKKLSKQERLKRRGRNLGRGRPKRLIITKKSRYMRRWLLRNPWIRPMCVFNYAAIKIQAIARTYIIKQRKRLKIPLSNHHSSRSQRKAISTIPLNKKISSKQLDRYLSYLDQSRRLEKERNQDYIPPSWLNGGFSAWSAVRIQSWWRMIASNKRLLQRRRLINQVAAIVIQTAWRNYHYFTPLIEEGIVAGKPNDPNSLAKRIQYCWRRYCNRRIYYYFRNLILFKLQGAPAELLRTIIPNEADLLDRASGVHVKFRLGGKIFPPKVYFKIFTHRPLCDVNAFAPRDYSQEKPANELYFHNKSTIVEKYSQMNKNNAASKRGNIRIGVKYFDTVVHTTNPSGLANWYQREDQNNWRPISTFLIEKVEVPPWFQDTVKQALAKHHQYYHFSKSVRKADLQTYRRRRKREWMMKLYKMHLKEDEQQQDYVDRNQKGTSKSHTVAEEKAAFRKSASDGKDLVGAKSEKSIFSADSREGNSFIENLEYKSQIFYESEKPRHFRKEDRIANMINLETKQKLPFVAPAKGKYIINEEDRKKEDEEFILNDSISSHYVGGGSGAKRDSDRHRGGDAANQVTGFPNSNHDDLLQWSLQLDYENYVKDWNLIGTSLPSDMLPKTIY